ncbi:MAG: S24 family peptidase, partial [Clostridia bacterium]|nr:S24 family peptidase [Clostridia bacterium]
LAPDDSMRGFRIHAGDHALVVPSQSPVDGAVMLVEYNNHRYLRKVKKLDTYQVLLQSYDREYDAVTAKLGDVNFIGRVVKLEITL